MARTAQPAQSQPGPQSSARFDAEHIAAVCDEAIRAVDTGAEGASVQSTPMAAYVVPPTEAHHLTAMTALRQVGYAAATMPSPQPPITTWIRITGWDRDALARRLDGLTVTAHQLTRDLADNVAHAIDAYAAIADLPEIDAPSCRAAANLRTKLRDQATAATGPRVPYNPGLLPAHPETSALLQRVRAQEHRVEDLISRTWLTATDAIARYAGLNDDDTFGATRAEALTDTLNQGIDWAKRDTIIGVLEWAREAGHGDAVAYAHWYAHTYHGQDDPPEPAVAYDAWHDHTIAQHPAVIAAHDHPSGGLASVPGDIRSVGPVSDAAHDQARNQTCARTTPQSGRRAS